ncbi:MAG: glycosyltransferase family 39 protein [Caldilineaceae bacterium]|nr:glycosyltransferase family 39 protein [Caldilineaceae bacterium]
MTGSISLFPRGKVTATLPIAFLAAILVVTGAWLRLLYALQVGLHVDEFITLWAARRILDLGVPMMPSGILYAKGLLTSYLAAGAMAIGGLDAFVARVPSVFLGSASIVAIFAAGWKEWNIRVGFLAAIGLALLPEAIDAAGRVRFYAQLMLWTLLLLWAAYRLTRNPGSGRACGLALLFFFLALFTQEEVLIQVPAIALGFVLWSGLRVLLRPRIFLFLAGVFALMLIRFLLETSGEIDSFESIQSNKPYVGLFFAAQSAWYAFGRLFVAPRRVAWTIFAFVALIPALYTLTGRRIRLRELAPAHQATLYFGLHLLWVWLFMITVIGVSWHDPRFICFVEPNWLLLGAAGVIVMVDRLLRRALYRWIATLAAGLTAVWMMLPLTTNALNQTTEEYAAALAFVGEQREPNDRIATPQPPACAWVLGKPCDYYARGLDYEPYVVPKGGKLVDRWTGAELIRSAEELAASLRSGNRLWLVVDSDRLGSRYDIAYLELILQQFDIAYESANTFVLVANGLRPAPRYDAGPRREQALPFGAMRLIDWRTTAFQAGEPLHAVLYWTAAVAEARQINTSLQLVAADSTRISQADGPPARGLVPTVNIHSEAVPDFKTLQLPAALPDGWYRLEVVAYVSDSQEPLADPIPIQWFYVGSPPRTTEPVPRTLWADGMELTGVSLQSSQLTPGASLDVRLTWRAARSIGRNYTASVQLLGPDGTLVAQNDRAPLDGFYPTSRWTTETVIDESYTLHLPNVLAPGTYILDVVWYDALTMERALREDGQVAVILATFDHPRKF